MGDMTAMRLARVDAGDPVLGKPVLGNPVLDILSRLLGNLHRQGIRYCYWKSTRRLQAVLAGEADLDLLVAREDQHRITRTLLESGFKLFPSVAHRDHPAILSFLGYDEPSGRIVHVHLHSCLVIGERLLKNYRLPWERSVLSHAVLDPTVQIRVLDPATEAVLLMVRACIEHRVLDPITLRSWRAIKQKFESDREALAAQVDRSAFRARCAELLDDVSAELLAGLFYEGGQRHQARACRHVRKELAAFRTYNAAEARLRSGGRALQWLAGGLNKRYLHVPRPWSRRVPGSGRVVALLGVDGSGKTTVVAAIRAWLGAEIDVMPIYFGTGDGRPSLLLLPLKLMVPLTTVLLRKKPKGSSHGSVSSRPPGLLYSALLTIWATALAVEKRGKLHAAHRGASRGMVVIADRYPQNEIADYNDGPLLPRLARVPRWLRRFEANAYALVRRLPPDLVVKLEAPPEVLAVREPSMDRLVILQRVGAVQRLTFPGARVVRVDATQPLDDVIRAVKAEIWSML